MPSQMLPVTAEYAEKTLAAFLRAHLPGQSWNQVRRLVETRRVRLRGDLCPHPARRLHEGEVIEFLGRPAPVPRHEEQLTVRPPDEHVVVREKPAGIPTVRPPAERDCD